MTNDPLSRSPGHDPAHGASGGRAIDDPVKLARAARIIRIGLERRRLRLEDPANRHHHANGDEFCTIIGCEVCE